MIRKPTTRKFSRAHVTMLLWLTFVATSRATCKAVVMVANRVVVVCSPNSAPCWASKRMVTGFTSADNKNKMSFRFLLKGLNPFIFMWNYFRYSAYLEGRRHMSDAPPYDFSQDVKYF